tara:strand:- start:242 stop:1123 length:882 start_codon:yes stop_codon:yes gene_type:complete
MPYANSDGIKLYYEESGSGTAVLFIHEFAGDHRSWEPQMRHFSARYRCVCYSARGYPPSDIPPEPESYKQEIQADDAARILDHLGIDKAHIVGLSMGGFATLHFGLRHPQKALSLSVTGCGYGADKNNRDKFIADAEKVAREYDRNGSQAVADFYAESSTRVQFQNKNPRGWAEFKRQLSEHSAAGAANTMRGYQKTRPSLYDIEEELKKLVVPTLVVTGDEDEPCLEPSLYLKRTIPSAGLSILPRSGHTINLEEPDIFNGIIANFLATVDGGRWSLRDPRSLGSAMLGSKE